MLWFSGELKQSVVLNSQAFIDATKYISAMSEDIFGSRTAVAMRYEHSINYTPKPPRSPSCPRIMPLARASRFEDLYIHYNFECRPCGTSRIDAVEIETT